MSKIKLLQEIEVKDLRVLVRVDFNVPLDSEGNITDDTRIRAALPTIEYLIDMGARVILMSHLGRPKGQKKEEYSLRPVADRLATLLEQPVIFVPECLGELAQGETIAMHHGNVVLLENLRFHAEEEGNGKEFSKELAKLGDVYVNDAFGTAHRAHASTVGVAELMETKAMGLLMEKEVEYLGHKLKKPEKPFLVILGGAKVSDKISVIEVLMDKADVMLIGGAMAYTFSLAQGHKVGNSLVEKDKVDVAKHCLEKAKKKGVKFLLPVDTLVTDELDFKGRKLGSTKVVETDIEDGWEGVDIGPKTVDLFTKEIEKAKTIVWNGPLGVSEIEASAKGTNAIAKAVAESGALSIVGGGDSVQALKQCGCYDKVTFVSTGGGASLEFLEGKELPGLKALKK